MNKKSLRRDMPERLVKFLKKRKLLTKFLNNIVNSFKEGFNNRDQSQIMRTLHSSKAISVFAWYATPERETFWVNIFFKYRDEYDNDSNRV